MIAAIAKGRKFTCESCNGVFTSGWTEEEAMEEYKQSKHYEPDHDKGLVCDDCYARIIKWLDGLTDAQKEAMR